MLKYPGALPGKERARPNGWKGGKKPWLRKRPRPQKDATTVAQSTQEEKLKALEHALADLDKQYGKGAVMKLGEQASHERGGHPHRLAWSWTWPWAWAACPRAAIIEIYGPESSGKTTVALHIVAEAQKQGGICAFIDAEHALDPVYAKKLGVDIDEPVRLPAGHRRAGPGNLRRRWCAPAPST